jgi:DNA-binding CsgD family transcriptional regulator
LQEAGSWFGELTGRKGDGQRFVAHVSASVVRDGTGQPIAYMGSFVDVTASRESQRELQEKNRQLEEVNTALRVLMDHRDSAREQLSENVLAGVNALVRPCLRRLWESGLTPAQEALADLLEVHLQELTESLPKRLSERFSGITPREMEIAAMIRQGRTSDEIAQALCISRNTVIFHRQNLRAKLGLQGRKKGLCACLREIMD